MTAEMNWETGEVERILINTVDGNNFVEMTLVNEWDDEKAGVAIRDFVTGRQTEYPDVDLAEVNWVELVESQRRRAVTYTIKRFYQDNRETEIIATGQSLEDAKAHCSDPDTKGDGWFDGFEEE